MNHSIKRIYHPYWLWEEIQYNMWGIIEDKDSALKTSIEFTGNHALYGEWMMKVISDWKYSCEHNLSNITQNRQAWIGHAACAYALKIPENIIRSAWSYLSEDQQRLANKEADKAIEYWEQKQCQNENYPSLFTMQR
jgi:hypothetical protein